MASCQPCLSRGYGEMILSKFILDFSDEFCYAIHMKSKKAKKEDHPFYCYAKQCRKSVWETPEFLSPDDWTFLKRVVDVLKTGDSRNLYDFLWSNENGILTKNFFNRSVGWPEGYCYCQDPEYLRATAFGCCFMRYAPKFEEALRLHSST